MRWAALLFLLVMACTSSAQACELRPFMAYFRADGSPGADMPLLLDDVVSYWRTLPESERAIVVEGHTDTVGDASENLARSERSAFYVRDELIRRSVYPTALTVAFHGESRPFVATGDNVAEPLNRVVTIETSYYGACWQGPPPPPPTAPKAQ